jgi:hypothetical protein
LIVGHWLKANPDALDAWAIKDLDKRIFVTGEVLRSFSEDPEFTKGLERELNQLEEMRKHWISSRGEPTEAVLNLEQMAQGLGLEFPYAYGYRVQSQVDVHATPHAVDACYERLPDGKLRLRPAPVRSLRQYDLYALGAHLLRDVLAVASDHLPGLRWRTGLEGITDALNAERQSDPRKRSAGSGGEDAAGSTTAD